VLCIATAAALVAYSVEGPGGMLLMLTGLVVLGSLTVMAFLPSAPPLPGHRRGGHAVRSSGYRSYDRVASDLSWAAVSPRHYDTTTRPMLQRLLAARLLENHGVDLTHQPEQARRLVGEDVWRYLDPARPADRSSQPPGVDTATLTQIAERLERL
jgi:hypothetical protein